MARRPDQREHPAVEGHTGHGRPMEKIGPKHRTCRRVGAALCGRPNCPSNKRPYPPGQHGRGRKRISEYQTRLVEKQKLRAIYGVSESQMRALLRATPPRSKGVTGEELIRQLETRLDTVVLRLGLRAHHAPGPPARLARPRDRRRQAAQRAERPRRSPGRRSRSRPRRRTSSPSARPLEITPDPPTVPLPEQGRGLRHAQPAARARRGPAPGRRRGAPDRRVLLLTPGRTARSTWVGSGRRVSSTWCTTHA